MTAKADRIRGGHPPRHGRIGI